MRTRPVITAVLSMALLPTLSLTALAATPPPSSSPATMVEALSRDLGISPDAARSRLVAQAAAERIAQALPAQVRAQSPGTWLDEQTGRLMVAVTDPAVAAQVAAAGATPTLVERDRAELRRLAAEVAKLAATQSGVTGWGIDPISATVTVRVTPGTSSARFAALGPGVRVTEVATAPVPQGSDVRPGGQWFPGFEGNCSVGFPATDSGGGRHFLTAGHCTNDANQPAWGSAGGQDKIGTSNVGGTHSVFGREGDMGLVDVTEPSWRLSASVHTYGGPQVAVSGSTEPIVNQAVCHAGITSHWQCGKVTAVDQTVVYASGPIDGISYTTACSLAGDSGGAWLAGDKAVGLHSGGYSSCSPGGAPDQSLFQPVNEALRKWGLTLYTGGGSSDTQAPTTPAAVRAIQVTADSATLTWEASTDNVAVTGYQVYNGTALATTTTATTVTVDSLTPETDYTFTVKAVDAAGNTSRPSAPITVRTARGDANRTFTNTTAKPIRDFQTTTSAVTSTAPGAAKSPVVVAITARHTCVEDLDITLTGPSGQRHTLHEFGGTTCHPLTGTSTYRVAVTEQASGTWTLSIHDGGPGDTGSLDRWAVTL